MYLEETPLKVEKNKLNLVAGILGLEIPKYKPEILAVAVANRFNHNTLSDRFYDNPTDIEIVGNKGDLKFVELTYPHPYGGGWPKQEFIYCVDVDKMSGFFIKPRKIIQEANGRTIEMGENDIVEIL